MWKAVKMSMMGKNSRNGQMDRIFMILKKNLTAGVILILPWGYIHVYEHYSQTNLLVYILDLR